MAKSVRIRLISPVRERVSVACALDEIAQVEIFLEETSFFLHPIHYTR